MVGVTVPLLNPLLWGDNLVGAGVTVISGFELPQDSNLMLKDDFTGYRHDHAGGQDPRASSCRAIKLFLAQNGNIYA
jgi:hypothetical protein